MKNLITFVFAVNASLACAAPEAQTEKQMAKMIGGQQLQYWLYLPGGVEEAKAGSIPVLLFLHGSGERGENLDRVLVHGPPKLVGNGSPFDNAIVISPQCPAGHRWQADTLKALLDEVLAAYPQANFSKLYITGLSMGGYGTWGMLAEYPELFAAAVPICGGGDMARLPKLREFRPRIPFTIEKLRRAKDVPIWAFHGDKDAAVPVGESRILIDDLSEAGGKSVRLTVYEGVGHDSWTRTYADPKVWEWLFDQNRADKSGRD